MLECGRRFADDELPSSTDDLRRYFWNPMLGMKGIFRLTTFRDVSVVSGCGVGGGSLGYANTLYVPPKAFFDEQQTVAVMESRPYRRGSFLLGSFLSVKAAQ